MSLQIDGEEVHSAEVDLSNFTPDTFTVYFYQGDFDFKSLEVTEVRTAERVSAKATTLTLLPGYNEDSRDSDGDDLNSSIPDLSILDESFLADNRLTLPEELDDAIRATRGPFPEYPGEEFKAYRLMNQIELCFETEDGRTISDWSTAELRINNEEDPISPDGEWQPSYILVEGEKASGEDNIVRSLIDDPDRTWFRGQDKLLGDPKGWREGDLRIDINRVSVGEVEGVRASLVRGARDSFVVEMKKRLLEVGEIHFARVLLRKTSLSLDDLFAAFGLIMGPPYFYTFIDLIVMADGSTYTRIWDASRYPAHYLYIGNDQEDDNEFEEGVDWNRNVSPRDNTRFMQTFFENSDSRTPFDPHVASAYEWNFDRDSDTPTPPGNRTPNASGPHPVMKHVQGGTILSETDLIHDEDIAEPHFPWK